MDEMNTLSCHDFTQAFSSWVYKPLYMAAFVSFKETVTIYLELNSFFFFFGQISRLALDKNIYKIQHAIRWTIVTQISPLLDINMRYISFLQTNSSPRGQTDRSLTRRFQQHMRYMKPGAGSDTSAVQFNTLIPTHKEQNTFQRGNVYPEP